MANTDLTQFDYKKVGQLDAAMWRSYYKHEFIKLFGQLVLLTRYQVRLNWLLTIRLAFHAAWAAADYRIHKQSGVNQQRVLKNLTRFYGLISRHSVERFDYIKAAELELAWWDVHRTSYHNHPALEKSLADAAATIFKVDPAKLTEYAHYRAEAMILPRHERESPENPTDWPKIEAMTIRAWGALHAAVQK